MKTSEFCATHKKLKDKELAKAIEILYIHGIHNWNVDEI